MTGTSPKRILIVDDEEAILQLFQKLMKHRFSECRVAMNGEQALKVLQEDSNISASLQIYPCPIWMATSCAIGLRTCFPVFQ